MHSIYEKFCAYFSFLVKSSKILLNKTAEIKWGQITGQRFRFHVEVNRPTFTFNLNTLLLMSEFLDHSVARI